LEQDLHFLILGCLANDRKAQGQLYRMLYGFAMRIALRYARDESDADDIMSHAFVKVFRSMQSFDSTKGSFYAWLKKIVINEALDHLKQRTRFTTIELEGAEEPGIENTVTDKIDMAAIMDLIRQLPPATHSVFVLYVTEGYAHKEIGELLGISEGTSKWHLSEARRILKQQLSNPARK